MSLNISKSSGCDDISPQFLKLCTTSLLSPITNLLSLGIIKCSLSQEWKIHKIRTIFKSGNIHCASNCRPISLCILSKVLELIVNTKSLTFCALLFPCSSQHYFIQGKSCLSQIPYFYSEMFIYFDKESPISYAIFFDFKKGFSTVPHQKLLFKLRSFEITSPLWVWFKDYKSFSSTPLCLHQWYLFLLSACAFWGSTG